MRHVLMVAGLLFALTTVVEVNSAEAKPVPAKPAVESTPSTVTPARSAMTPTKRALIDQLLTLTQQEKLFQQSLSLAFSQLQKDLPALLDQVGPIAAQNGAQSSTPNQVSPERQAVQSMLDRIMPKFMREVQQSISFQELVDQVYYPMYDRHFSEGELKDILAFYKSPTGKRTIQVMPQLVQDSLQMTNRIMLPKLMGIMQRLMAEEAGKPAR